MADREQVQHLLLLMGCFSASMSSAITQAVGPELSNSATITTLFLLDLEGPRRPGALQEMTGLSSGGVSKLVDRLEAQGLVRRVFGPVDGDRRAVLVQLTPKGRRLSRRIAQIAGKRADEQSQLLKTIASLADM